MTRRNGRGNRSTVGRRKFLFGSGVAAATLVIGSSAFSQVRAEQRINVGIAGDQGAYLQIVPKEDNQYAWLDTNDELNVEMDRLRRDSETTFAALLELRNEGTKDVGLYVEESDFVGTVLDFRVGGDSVVGESAAAELPVGEAVDVSVVVDLLDNSEEDLPDDGEVDVMFVADADALNEGSEEGGEGGTGGGETGSLSVDVPGTVQVGSSNAVGFTATLSDTGSGGQDATVAVDVGGEVFDEKTVSVPDGGEAEAAFSVPTVYDEVEDPEADRHGSLRFDGTAWSVTAEFDGETDVVEGTLAVEDDAIEFYEPDGDVGCAVCNMMTAMFDGWHAQATHADGTRVEFCSTGCLVSYVVDPVHHGAPDAPVEGVWVVDFDERPSSGTELIDARDAYFVLDSETADKFSTPMGGSPPAFPDYDAAAAYVDGYDGSEYEELTEDDIVTLDDFNDSVANSYRDNFHS
jgi:nitrous oxide reductase accessory protein NosL